MTDRLTEWQLILSQRDESMLMLFSIALAVGLTLLVWPRLSLPEWARRWGMMTYLIVLWVGFYVLLGIVVSSGPGV